MRFRVDDFRLRQAGKKIGLLRVEGGPLLEFTQLAACRLDHAAGNPGQCRDLDAVALVGRAVFNRVQEDDFFVMLDGIQMHVGKIRVFVREAGQFEIMGGEQRQRPVLLDQMAANGKGQRHAVEGRSAAPDLVHQHQRVFRRVMQNRRRFGHLHHEGRTSGSEIVRRTNAREDLIERAERHAAGRNKAADMCHQGDQRRLPHIGRFTAHVRAGDQQQATAVTQARIVGDEGFAIGQLVFHHRMPPAFDGEARLS